MTDTHPHPEGVHPDEMTTAFLVAVMQLADDHHLRLHALSVLNPANDHH